MTTYGAYDAGLPCKNTACKSHGKPHPNCRCYGNMAEGGEVGSFCDLGQPHEVGCEYFAEGGPVGERDSAADTSAFLARHGFAGLLSLSKYHPDFYNAATAQGHRHIENHISSIFSGEAIPAKDHSRQNKKIDDWLASGHLVQELQDEQHDQNAPQAFAQGGKVEKSKSSLHTALAETHPDDNLLLQTAKGRISQYLNSQRPQENMPRLAFDAEPDQSVQKKSYESARNIAAHPLGILKHVQDGTLEQEHIGHFNAMYPELGEALQKKLTEKVIDAQLKGKKPSYKARSALSMFLGAPLSGELLPSNIQAAQSVFAKQAAAKQSKDQEPRKIKKSSVSLTKSSEAYLTDDQAREKRIGKV